MTTNELWFTPVGASYPLHTIGPIPPDTGPIGSFPDFNAPFGILLPAEEPSIPIDASYRAVVTSPRSFTFTLPRIGVGEFQYNLVPDDGSAPASDTEG